MRSTITKFTDSPPCGGPYSLGVKASGDFLFVAGQGPWDPRTNAFRRSSIAEQTQLTLENVRRVVEAAGSSMKDVVSCRVFLQNLNTETFAEMNQVYAGYWPENPPVRTTVGAQLLGIDVEIDCIALLPKK